ncbi:hypothetical protein [Arthrobacter sp. StoSoilB13]|uniref:hypothetical protein n=1 Tax=Arthrobacter sp. StoSoilB13 TaxID=2830993 RepID=UPI001CC70851|nr:hypothetical protein [Arthrobacter sp. StoSoilB13]BCW52087.1 hypothetical protein StoSoilB13_44290 [Arthrobacter sp. StoSoilB13]
MSQTHEHQSTLRVSSDSGDTVSFTLDATKPVTVKLQVDGGCTCGTTATVQGSYVDSDLGKH